MVECKGDNPTSQYPFHDITDLLLGLGKAKGTEPPYVEETDDRSLQPGPCTLLSTMLMPCPLNHTTIQAQHRLRCWRRFYASKMKWRRFQP